VTGQTKRLQHFSPDRSSPVPLYHQVAEQLEAAIKAGELLSGAHLGNEIDLAQKLGVSRPTLRMAIASLVDKGLLIRRRGIGTVVAPFRVSRPIALTSLWDDLERAGRRPATTVLRLEPIVCPPEVAEALQLDTGTTVTLIERLRYANGQPIALMRNFLPVELVVTREDLERSGLYQILRAQGVELRIATQTIGARLAQPPESRLLDIPRREPLLYMHRTAYGASSSVVEYGDHAYPASRYAFEMSLLAR